MTRRRSKVRSKTRSDSSQKSEDEILYCICRSSDGTRFMIACDNCEEWYHGDCINVTPKQANNIKRFFCHLCIGRNPSLEIEYKTSKENRPRLPNLRQQIKKTNFSSDDDENDADLSSSSSPDKSLASTKSKRAMRKRWRPSISESVVKKRRGRPKERQDEYDEEATEDEIETSGIVPSMSDCIDDGVEENEYSGRAYRSSVPVGRVVSGRGQVGRPHLTPTATTANRSFIVNNYGRVSSKNCGVCEPCKITVDCGQCDLCARFGHDTRMRYVCRKRRCVGSDYRGQQRRQYQVSKEYGAPVGDDYDGLMEDEGNGEYGARVSGVNAMRRRPKSSEYGTMPEMRQRMGASTVCGGGGVGGSNSNVKDNVGATIGSKMRRGDHLPGGSGNHSSSVHRRGIASAAGGGVTGVPYKCYGEQQSLLDLANNATSYRYTNNNRLSRNQQAQQQQQPPSSSSYHQYTSAPMQHRRVRTQSDAAQLSSNTSSVSGQMSSHHYNQHHHHQQYGGGGGGEVDDSDEDVMIPNEHISPNNAHFSNYQAQQQQHRANKNIGNIDSQHYPYGLTYPDHLYCKHHRLYNWHDGSSGGGGVDSEMAGVSARYDPASTKASSLVVVNSAAPTSSSSLSSSDKDTVHPRLRSPAREPPQSSSAATDNHHHHQQHQRHVKTHTKSAVSLATNNTDHLALSSYQVVDLNQSMIRDTTIGGSSTGSSSGITGITDPLLQHKSCSLHTSGLTNNNTDTAAQCVSTSLSSVFNHNHNSLAAHTHAHTQSHTNQEFYTINDEDDLEINWPKETVNV